jgi:hypothetical protein
MSFIICSLLKNYYGNKIKEFGMGRAFGMHGRGEIYKQKFNEIT